MCALLIQAAWRTLETQDVRSPDARDGADRRGGGRPINVPDATTIDSATIWPTERPARRARGAEWTRLGIGVVDGLLATGEIAGLAGCRSRRLHRLRVGVLAATSCHGADREAGTGRSWAVYDLVHKASTTSVVGCETAERRSLRSGRLSARLSAI
jgi:hypothetical protein